MFEWVAIMSSPRLVRHLARLAKHAFNEDHPGAVLALFVLGYGLPLQDVLTLRRSDIDIGAKSLRVKGFDLPLSPPYIALLELFMLMHPAPVDGPLFVGVRLREAHRWVSNAMDGVNAQTLFCLAIVGTSSAAGAGEVGEVMAKLVALGADQALVKSVEREFTARLRAGLLAWHAILFDE